VTFEEWCKKEKIIRYIPVFKQCWEAARAHTARIIGDHWCEVAASRMRAGEPEEAVMKDYGYTRETK